MQMLRGCFALLLLLLPLHAARAQYEGIERFQPVRLYFVEGQPTITRDGEPVYGEIRSGFELEPYDLIRTDPETVAAVALGGDRRFVLQPRSAALLLPAQAAPALDAAAQGTPPPEGSAQGAPSEGRAQGPPDGSAERVPEGSAAQAPRQPAPAQRTEQAQQAEQAQRTEQAQRADQARRAEQVAQRALPLLLMGLAEFTVEREAGTGPAAGTGAVAPAVISAAVHTQDVRGHLICRTNSAAGLLRVTWEQGAAVAVDRGRSTCTLHHGTLLPASDSDAARPLFAVPGRAVLLTERRLVNEQYDAARTAADMLLASEELAEASEDGEAGPGDGQAAERSRILASAGERFAEQHASLMSEQAALERADESYRQGRAIPSLSPHAAEIENAAEAAVTLLQALERVARHWANETETSARLRSAHEAHMADVLYAAKLLYLSRQIPETGM
jgi:hypothetical protein